MSPSPDPDLRERFPDLEPISGAPALFRINGIGTAMHGRRDVDAETGTFVATLVLTVVFVPVLALRAYRVGHARGTWYFLGRVPMSRFARGWNQLLAIAAAVALSWSAWVAYTGSPAYLGGRRAEVVEAACRAGSWDAALAGADALARDFESEAAFVARARAVAATATAAVLAGDVELLAAAVPRCLVVAEHRLLDQPRRTVLDAALARLAVVAAGDPARRYRLLTAWAPIPLEGADPYAAPRRELLEAAARAHPDDVALAGDWAAVLVAEDHGDQARALLEPLRARLGDGEGARILGTILADEGDIEGAYALLWPYARERLGAYHRDEQAWRKQLEADDDAALARLREGAAGRGWYARYDAADEAAKKAMVQEYLGAAIAADRQATELGHRVERASAIVGVAFRLGMVSLRRAERLAGAEREDALKHAEQALVAVEGSLGDDDRYQLYLGQVRYWLGQADDGRARFDAVLKKKPDAATAVAVAEAYRCVGEIARARTLLEEAYAKAGTDDDRGRIASQRSLLAEDLEDDVRWTSRDPRGLPETRAMLASAQGALALQQGRDDEARARLREAVAAYAAMPETTSSLNNGAVNALTLFRLTGAVADLRAAIAMQRRALRLAPDDATLVYNTASDLTLLAALEVVGDRLDYARLHQLPGLGDLGWLYHDRASRLATMAALRADPALNEARDLLERLLLIMPRSPKPYLELMDLLAWTGDDARSADLAAKAEGAALDLADQERESRRLLADPVAERARLRALTVVRRDRLRARVAADRGADATAAHLRADLIEAELQAARYGESVDLAALAAEADALAEATPCAATASVRMTARAAVLLAAVVADQPDGGGAAAWVHDPDAAAALFAGRTRDARARLTALPAYRAWLAQLASSRALDPDFGGAVCWALARDAEPAIAAALAARSATDVGLATRDRVSAVLSRWYPAAVFKRALRLRCLGHDDQADALLTEAEAHGCPAALIR